MGYFHRSEWVYASVFLMLIFLPVFLALPAHAQETVDLEAYGKECDKGMTIYCLAAGMEEQKSGNLENALRYYQSACDSHSTRGHLRACTPYLSLARQLKRLDDAGAGLEALCRDGEDKICFYLAKEYIKIAEHHRGYVHLERLCLENFQPPDDLDYGPCYHLASALKNSGKFLRAVKIFKFDCDRDPSSAQPSCGQADAVNAMLRQKKNRDGGKVAEIRSIESAAFAITAIPLLSLLLLLGKGDFNLKLLRIPVPILTIFCWALWEPHARRELALRADLSFIVPAVILAFLLAWLAHLRLQGYGRGTEDP